MRFFKKRSIWLPTWPVALLVIGGALVLAGVLFFGSHGFLSATRPAPGAKMLVVEAWLADESIERVAEILNGEGSPYEEVWLVGPSLAHGTYLSDDYRSFAELGKATLEKLGVPAGRLMTAPPADAARHRTFAAGEKLHEALSAAGRMPDTFDVITLDVHARRSGVVYSKIFADAEVGVISLPARGYDSGDWFKSSSGMKNVIFEVIAYVYEKIGDSGR